MKRSSGFPAVRNVLAQFIDVPGNLCGRRRNVSRSSNLHGDRPERPGSWLKALLRDPL